MKESSLGSLGPTITKLLPIDLLPLMQLPSVRTIKPETVTSGVLEPGATESVMDKPAQLHPQENSSHDTTKALKLLPMQQLPLLSPPKLEPVAPNFVPQTSQEQYVTGEYPLSNGTFQLDKFSSISKSELFLTSETADKYGVDDRGDEEKSRSDDEETGDGEEIGSDDDLQILGWLPESTHVFKGCVKSEAGSDADCLTQTKENEAPSKKCNNINDNQAPVQLTHKRSSTIDTSVLADTPKRAKLCDLTNRPMSSTKPVVKCNKKLPPLKSPTVAQLESKALNAINNNSEQLKDVADSISELSMALIDRRSQDDDIDNRIIQLLNDIKNILLRILNEVQK